MKKSISIILFILIISLLSITVFADMDAPSVKPYSAIVNKVEGADYYEYDYDDILSGAKLKKKGTLDYGTEFEVNYEEKFNGKIYCYFIIDNSAGSIFGYIDAEDVDIISTNVSEDFKPNSAMSAQFTVLDKNGIDMYKGPAYAYETVGNKIPYNAKITAYEFSENGSNPWYFLTYKDVDGYICNLDGVLGKLSTDIKSIKTSDEVKVYASTEDFFKDDATPIATLAPNTIINSFLEIDDWSRGYYITGSKSGYISSYDHVCISRYDANYIVTIPEGNVSLYEYANLESPILIDHVTEGKSFNFEYSDDLLAMYDEGPLWVNITFEGKNGWVPVSWEDVSWDEIEDFTDESEIQDIDTEDLEDISEEEIILEDEITDNNDEFVVNLTLKQIALICAVVALIVALTATVTVILVNKKSNNNQNNNDNNE